MVLHLENRMAKYKQIDTSPRLFNERCGDVYNAKAASLAWEHMIAFFTQHLG